MQRVLVLEVSGSMRVCERPRPRAHVGHEKVAKLRPWPHLVQVLHGRGYESSAKCVCLHCACNAVNARVCVMSPFLT